MKTVTINEVTYTQAEETECGLCYGCICYGYMCYGGSEKLDKLFKKLSLASGNDCQDAIWKEVEAKDE